MINFSSAINQAQGALRTGVSEIRANLPRVEGQINAALPQFQSRLSQIQSDKAEILGQLNGGNISSIIDTNLAGQFTNLTGALGNPLQNFGGNISGLTDRLQVINLDNITGGLDRIGGSIGALGGRINEVTNAFQDATTFLGAAQTKGIDGLFKESIDDLTDGFKQFARNAGSNFESTVAAFSSGDLIGAFDSAQNLLNGISNPFSALTGGISALTNLGNNAGGNSTRGSGESLVPNPLRNFNSFNSVIELGALSISEINNNTYVGKGYADEMIVRNVGGKLERRVQTDFEGSQHAEYYIEDLEIKTLISPNPRSGVAKATKVTFKVIEPYSMGQFLQALQIGALNAGFPNYLKAPFLLSINFVGHTESGTTEFGDKSQRLIPIKLIKSEMNVESGGTTYDVSAIAWSESAYYTEVQTLKEEVKAKGTTVKQLLSDGAESVTSILNTRKSDREEKEGDNAGSFQDDRFFIAFPQGRNEIANSVSSGFSGVDRLAGAISNLDNLAGVFAQARDIGVPDELLTINISGNNTQGLSNSVDAAILGSSNLLGQQLMVQDFTTEGAHDYAQARYTVDADNNRIFARNGVELSLDDLDRTYTFPRGMKLEDVITEVILLSNFGSALMKQRPNAQGKYTWFRIDSKVFIKEDAGYYNIHGRFPCDYVYEVKPYLVDAQTFMHPNEIAPAVSARRNSAVKTYNYIYTGKNEDVLDFQINLKAAFYEAVQADTYDNIASNRSGAKERVTAREVVRTSLRSASVPNTEGGVGDGFGTPSLEEVTDNVTGGNTARRGETSSSMVARQFHDKLLNSSVDLLTANLSIMGDPYFLSDTGTGNYDSLPGMNPYITDDGQIDYQTGEVDIVVNFKTPLDYNNDGTMSLQTENFSGLYKVLAVTSVFTQGNFTQELKLLRRRNQNSESGNNNKLPVEEAYKRFVSRLTGNADPVNVGYDAGEVDPALARAAGINPSTGQRGSSTGTGQGQGQLATIRSSINGKSTRVAATWQDAFQGLIDELEQDYGYEINVLYGYVDRDIAGSSDKSWHAAGLAIDINPAQNPHNKPPPQGGTLVTDMPEGGTGSAMVALAAKYGLGWGGNWNSSKDAMHFSAGSNEQGTYTGPRGIIPGAPIEPEATGTTTEPVAPPAASDPDASDPRGRDQRATPSPHPPTLTGNPDANDPRQEAARGRGGSSPLPSQSRTTTGELAGPSGAGAPSGARSSVSNPRPYDPMQLGDTWFDFATGQKRPTVVISVSAGGGATQAGGQAGAPPSAQPSVEGQAAAESQVGLDAFGGGSDYSAADARNVEDLNSFNADLGGGPSSAQLTPGERAYAIERGYISTGSPSLSTSLPETNRLPGPGGNGGV